MSADRPAASNAVVRPVVDYAPDPHGSALFFGLAAAINSGLHGARPVVESGPAWHGWTRPLQAFRGAAALGTANVYAPRNSELSREKTTVDSNAAAIFRSRMARGQR